MKVNLQILFRIFCKYSLIQVSCGIFHMKLYLLKWYSASQSTGYSASVQPDRKDTKDEIKQENFAWGNKLRKWLTDLWFLVCSNLRFMFQPFTSSFRNLDIFCFIFLKIYLEFFLSRFSEEDKVYNQHKDLLERRIKSFLLSTGTSIVLLFPFSSIFL